VFFNSQIMVIGFKWPRSLRSDGHNCWMVGKVCLPLQRALWETQWTEPTDSAWFQAFLFFHKRPQLQILPSPWREEPCRLGWDLRASPTVLSMWLQTVKFIAKGWKCASLAQEVSFSTPNSSTLPWLVNGATELCNSKNECNKLHHKLHLTEAQYF
jgi:hypothetical protein